jgi:hypothetical protein
MQFFKINCLKVMGNAVNNDTHYVVATSEADAIAAIMSDAMSKGYDCTNQQVIPIQSDVMVGS